MWVIALNIYDTTNLGRSGLTLSRTVSSFYNCRILCLRKLNYGFQYVLLHSTNTVLINDPDRRLQPAWRGSWGREEGRGKKGREGEWVKIEIASCLNHTPPLTKIWMAPLTTLPRFFFFLNFSKLLIFNLNGLFALLPDLTFGHCVRLVITWTVSDWAKDLLSSWETLMKPNAATLTVTLTAMTVVTMKMWAIRSTKRDWAPARGKAITWLDSTRAAATASIVLKNSDAARWAL